MCPLASNSRAVPRGSRAGLTLIEMLMTLTIMAVLTFASIALVSDSMSESKFEETVQKLARFKTGILGDPTLKENGVRTSFGYVGDMGGLPDFTAGLAGLVSLPSGATSYAIDANSRFGVGWNGPYVHSSQGVPDTTVDSWGNPILYDPTTSPPTITSYGADGSLGGSGYNQDITVSLSDELYKGTVHGFINNKGAPYDSDAEVWLYRADGSGAITKDVVNLVTGDKGYFSFNNVAFGKRSVVVYIPSQAAATTTLGPVLFTMDRKNLELNESWLDINP